MGKDYGEPMQYDPDFKGPTHSRSCTDVIFLIAFILFLGLWAFVGYHGINNGDIQKLLAPIDSEGYRCGLDSNVKDKSYLVFFDITQCLTPGSPIVGCPTKQVCVSQCPTETYSFQDLTAANFIERRRHMVCTYDVNVLSMTLTEARNNIDAGKCAKHVVKSQNVLSRCIGDLSTLCKNEGATDRGIAARDGATCERYPSAAQQSLMSRATALDSYIGWIAAGWVTFFTKNERDTHIPLFILYANWGMHAVMGRCFPDVLNAIAVLPAQYEQLAANGTEAVLTAVSNLVKFNELSAQIVQDLVQSRWYLLGGLIAVVVLCFIYILLLRWVVAPVVWASILGLVGVLSFSIYLCYKNYDYYRLNPVTLNQTTNILGYVQSIFSKKETWMVILVAVSVMLLIILLILIFLRKRISIAIALLKEGSKAVSAVKTTVFFPIFPWALQCFVIAYGVLVLMYLLSIGEPTFKVVNFKNDTCVCEGGVYTEDYVTCDPLTFSTKCHDVNSMLTQCQKASCHFIGLDSSTNTIPVPLLHLLNVLAFCWTMFFISGVADMMLASTFSTWYWTVPKRDLPFFTLTAGIYRTVRYHLGTVAFGAMILAIVRTIRVILEYIDHKLKKFDNPFTRCILCCCKCFFWCLENFIKFINKNAYIMCAVHGGNFCKSARDAFSLLMRNIVRVVVLDKVTDFIFFLSKMLMSIGVGIAVYYLLKWEFVYEVTQGAQLHHNYIPAIILGIATYFICTIFFNVYQMAVDTLFLCFLEDCERNDGSLEKPYMSKDLMKILGKRNKQA